MGDAADLFQRAVLVVSALNGEDGTGNPRQVLLNIPGAKLRMEPNVIPAPENSVYIVVIAPQSLPQARGLVGNLRRRDAGNRHVFDEDMRRKRDDAGYPPAAAASVDQRDRSSIAVAEEDW